MLPSKNSSATDTSERLQSKAKNIQAVFCGDNADTPRRKERYQQQYINVCFIMAHMYKINIDTVYKISKRYRD